MHQGQFIFSQLIKYLPKRAFDCLVNKYEGNKYVKSFTCWNHLLVLIIGQLSNRESLRDLIVSLNAHQDKFHHLGLGKGITRSNLAKANEVRAVIIFKEFSERMISIAQKKETDPSVFPLSNEIYAFDSTTITFCMNTFWWSKPQESKGGIKLHTLYDVKREIPIFNVITDHSVSDSTVMDDIPYHSGAFYIFDKAYVSTPQLHNIEIIHAHFVVRRKQNMKYSIVEDKNYNNTQTGIMADQRIKFTSRIAKKGYPSIIRQVTYYSSEQKSTFVFLTNNFKIPAEDVALLYRYRWSIEIFFKWIKQHLRIKEFYGTSENAVKIQIYSAIITYCLINIIGKDLKLNLSTYEVLRILSLSLFEKSPLRELFKEREAINDYQNDTQLNLNFF